MLLLRHIMKMLIIFMASCIYTIALFAQATVKTALTTQSVSQSSSPSTIEPLSVGDKVPDIEFTMLNYPTAKARLYDFRGKLVILDFWATWCTSCIVNFSKMDSLQKKFGDQLQVILVNTKNTGDDPKKIEGFFKKWKTKQSDFRLPIAIMDSIADLLFVHNLIPHYVWIDTDGKVTAITASDQITTKNIQKLLIGKDVELSLKKDINANRPIYLSDDLNIHNLTHYSIFIKGKLDGLPSGNRLRRSGDIVRGRAMTNTPLLSMYRIVINEISEAIQFNDNRMILEVSDSSKLFLEKAKAGKDAWHKENLYTYDLIVPVSEAEKLYHFILEDLNRYSGYYGRIEKRKTKCMILVRTSNEDKINAGGGKGENKLYDKEKRYLKNTPISHLINFLNGTGSIPLPVIDGTDFTNNIEVQLPANLKDFNTIRKTLQQYDLDLIEDERMLDMFVLTERNL
jgi:thiol-disulfide isomerase/thioredoxin